MKLFTVVLLSVVTMAVLVACNNGKDRYVDLASGKTVILEKDEKSGLMVDAGTKKPIRIYVDTEKNDTIWGKTGVVINGNLQRSQDGIYIYAGDNDGGTTVTGDDYKKKVDSDGDIKIKDGDTKTKIDGETGKTKVKKD
jgi:hypothetical protein